MSGEVYEGIEDWKFPGRESSVKRENTHRVQSPSFGLCLGSILFIAALWIVFVGGIHRNEMLVGAAVLLLSEAFLYLVWRAETLNFDLRLRDIAQGWRIPWYILSRDYEIVVILLKDALGLKRADSFYRVSGFKTSKKDPSLVARRILATFYTTMAPNFIVIGIDFRRNRMLFHQLERSSVSRMTKALGAQPGTNQP